MATHKPILELLTFGQNPFLTILDAFFLILGPRDPVGNPFQPGYSCVHYLLVVKEAALAADLI